MKPVKRRLALMRWRRKCLAAAPRRWTPCATSRSATPAPRRASCRCCTPQRAPAAARHLHRPCTPRRRRARRHPPALEVMRGTAAGEQVNCNPTITLPYDQSQRARARAAVLEDGPPDLRARRAAVLHQADARVLLRALVHAVPQRVPGAARCRANPNPTPLPSSAPALLQAAAVRAGRHANSLEGTRCLGGAAATLAGRSGCCEHLNNCIACRSMFVDRHIRSS